MNGEVLLSGEVLQGMSMDRLALGALVLLLALLIIVPSLRRRSRRMAMRRLEKTLPPARPDRSDGEATQLASRLENRLAALEAQLARRGGEPSDARLVDAEARLQVVRRELDALNAEREAQKLEVVAHETELSNLRDAIAASARQAYGGSATAAELAELRASLASETLRREAAVEEARSRMEELRRAGETIERQRLELATLRGALPALPPPSAAKASLPAEIGVFEREIRARKAEEAGSPAAEAADEALREQLKAIGAAVAQLADQESPGERPALPTPAAGSTGGIGARAGLAGLAARIRALQEGDKD